MRSFFQRCAINAHAILENYKRGHDITIVVWRNGRNDDIVKVEVYSDRAKLYDCDVTLIDAWAIREFDRRRARRDLEKELNNALRRLDEMAEEKFHHEERSGRHRISTYTYLARPRLRGRRPGLTRI
jgi:hypothetical protein